MDFKAEDLEDFMRQARDQQIICLTELPLLFLMIFQCRIPTAKLKIPGKSIFKN